MFVNISANYENTKIKVLGEQPLLLAANANHPPLTRLDYCELFVSIIITWNTTTGCQIAVVEYNQFWSQNMQVFLTTSDSIPQD